MSNDKPGYGAFNETSSDRLTGEHSGRDLLKVLFSSYKNSLNNKSVEFNDGPYFGIVIATPTMADKKESGYTPVSEILPKNRNTTVWQLKVVVPEIHTTSCLPEYLDTDRVNWEESAYADVHKAATFYGDRPIGSQGHDDVKAGDIVAVKFSDIKAPLAGGIYLGKAYDKRKVWDQTKKGKKAFKTSLKSAALKAVYSADDNLITCIDINDKEEVCIPAFDKKRCYNELSTTTEEYKVASTDPLKEQKLIFQKLPWLTSPQAGGHIVNKVGWQNDSSIQTARETSHRSYVDPMSLSLHTQLIAYQALCYKNIYSTKKMPKDVATFYDNGTGGVGMESKKIIKKITLPSKYSWISSSARTFKANHRLELVFRMVFHQIHLLREDGYPDLDKFKISKMVGYKGVREVRGERFKNDQGKEVPRYKLVSKNPFKVKDLKLSEGNEDVIYDYPEKISSHSFGITLDINEKVNGSWQNPLLPKGDWDNLFDWRAARDLEYETSSTSYKIPDIVIQAFKAYGFRWGGNFNPQADTMHFDFVGDPTYVLASYINGIVFAIKNKGAGGWTGEGEESNKYTAKRLIIGTKGDKWNKSLLEYLKKTKISASGLF